MKSLFEKYEAAKKESDAIESAFENDLFNEELEARFDEAYKKEFAAFTELADAIVKLTNGKVDAKTARAMIQTRFEDVKALLANA